MSATTEKIRATTEKIRIGLLWAASLKRLYPGRLPGSLDAKRCAGDFEVSVRTAESWSDGQAPRLEHVRRGLELHGWGLVVGILAPGEEVDHMARIDALEERFAALGAEIASLRAERSRG